MYAKGVVLHTIIELVGFFKPMFLIIYMSRSHTYWYKTLVLKVFWLGENMAMLHPWQTFHSE